MKLLKLIFKNSLRHKLRSSLTIIGIAIAIIAFGLLRTVVTVWNSGVDAASANRLITRQAVSFIFPLPASYRAKIASVPGVKEIGAANWFGGVYKDKSNFFAHMAVDDNYFVVYPEFIVPKDEMEEYKKNRNACIIGSQTAKQYNIKLGDQVVLEGDIYPGRWEFNVKGIYTPRDQNTDATQMLFHYEYLNETMLQQSPGRANSVGWYIVQIEDPNNSASVSKQIDALFMNSTAETKTETEKAFTQGFISASGAIITSMNFMSFAIIGIIMLVLANTMIMAARERTREYAVFKTLGFSAKHLTGLILGESLLISFLGGGVGLFLLYPLIEGFERAMPKGFFPYFYVEPITIILAVTATLLVGVLSSVFPIHRALNTKIVDGFRHVG
ncbi:MAG: FtsX-like permease family protein [Bacteroidetes bacterium]|nr:FtsX-like permease family protein [Bacteroidota bacterium]MBU1115862.1 FtsX-like permease family protein [Bacteroidota bacterium]MBU1797976.1 FtsX-like permease family protein [Bacteroidota bacterium]